MSRPTHLALGSALLGLALLVACAGPAARESANPRFGASESRQAAPPGLRPAKSWGPVVLDPGHGGEDSGALGSCGFRESDLVLAVALETRDFLAEVAPEIDVRLTREDDVFLPLGERMADANQMEAELFISLHANAARRVAANGIETFLLSAEASDDDARRVALAENAALRYEDGADPNDPLLQTLISLASAEQIRRSEEAAGLIHSRLTASVETTNRGVKQAPFFVLSRAQMPAVLIELGFLTNPVECERLKTVEYRSRIVHALGHAIVAHRDQVKAGGGRVSASAEEPR